MKARSADLVLVDEGDLQPELGSAEGSRIAACAGAEDHEVEVVGGADSHHRESTRGVVRGANAGEREPSVSIAGQAAAGARLGLLEPSHPKLEHPWDRISRERSASCSSPIWRARSPSVRSWLGWSAGRTFVRSALAGPAARMRFGHSVASGPPSSCWATCSRA